ncbi:hypothetical protein [Gluconacetobacter diazotrophicus]|uniref:hypothetical protein n=1 Tax=Gluconacetobacter diazotrophicus TaxID=33996 RepID=UPI001199AB23|nr:hypothetical protein [Gluconacetobacter diazotrophicus]TWA98117.1 hypothetical protein FBZ86_1586 [Gluconacetobacter diazotrophicus]
MNIEMNGKFKVFYDEVKKEMDEHRFSRFGGYHINLIYKILESKYPDVLKELDLQLANLSFEHEFLLKAHKAFEKHCIENIPYPVAALDVCSKSNVVGFDNSIGELDIEKGEVCFTYADGDSIFTVPITSWDDIESILKYKNSEVDTEYFSESIPRFIDDLIKHTGPLYGGYTLTKEDIAKLKLIYKK